MVGSKDSLAEPNIVLNTIVAGAFAEAADELEKAADFDITLHNLIKKYATEHQRIIFNGDGYSDGWVREAERRGLPNVKNMVDAIPAFNSEKSVALFERFGVFTKAELDSRVEIEYEIYAKTINIEAKSMIDIASKHILPAVIRNSTRLADSVNQVKQVNASYGTVQESVLNETDHLLVKANAALKRLTIEEEVGKSMAPGREQAVHYRDHVLTAMEGLRAAVDQLEFITDKDIWPMPSYGDLLFEV